MKTAYLVDKGIGGINDILSSKQIVDNMISQASSILTSGNNFISN
jgi:hypothetical protein